MGAKKMGQKKSESIESLILQQSRNTTHTSYSYVNKAAVF